MNHTYCILGHTTLWITFIFAFGMQRMNFKRQIKFMQVSYNGLLKEQENLLKVIEAERRKRKESS